jgi:hypothetical protein
MKRTIQPVSAPVNDPIVMVRGHKLPKSIADGCESTGHFIRCAQVYASIQEQLVKADGKTAIEVDIGRRKSGRSFRMVRGQLRRV